MIGCLSYHILGYLIAQHNKHSVLSYDALCELSLDPEVAILFGREIEQSNDGILLTDCWICKDKSRLVTLLIKVLVYNFYVSVTTIFMS